MAAPALPHFLLFFPSPLNGMNRLAVLPVGDFFSLCRVLRVSPRRMSHESLLLPFNFLSGKC